MDDGGLMPPLCAYPPGIVAHESMSWRKAKCFSDFGLWGHRQGPKTPNNCPRRKSDPNEGIETSRRPMLKQINGFEQSPPKRSAFVPESGFA
eukprot:2959878-Pyramimonas_sp.AAC.1